MIVNCENSEEVHSLVGGVGVGRPLYARLL